VGLIAFVLFILYRFIRGNYSYAVGKGLKKQYLLIIAGSFILTSGNALSRLADMLFALRLHTPFFAIDMITLILATFFVICFIGSSGNRFKVVFAILLALLFAFANGRAGLLRQWVFPLAAIMFVLALGSIIFDARTTKKEQRKREREPHRFDRRPLRNILLFVLISALLAVGVFFVSGDANVWDFSLDVITSSLSSFGGGEVYIGISETVFVQTGFIPEEIFNTQIIGIANTLPGPVIVSMVTGIGFTYGNINHGIGFGWMFGLLGLSLTITATAFGALLLYMCFEFLKDSGRLKMIVQYIMSVVCGMLISTALSLLRQAGSVLVDLDINAFLSIGIVLGIFAFMLFLHKRFRLGDIALLLLGGGGTTTILGVFSYLS
jgi:chromate transporter